MAKIRPCHLYHSEQSLVYVDRQCAAGCLLAQDNKAGLAEQFHKAAKESKVQGSNVAW